jgi:hypothetical protein
MKYTLLSSSIKCFDTAIIEDILKKNKIDFFFKSSYKSAVQAGWMTPGASFNEKMLFVDSIKLDKAEAVLNKYL